MQKALLRIGGKDVESSDRRTYQKSSGYTREPIAEVAEAGPSDARAAAAAAQAAFPEWSKTPLAKRRAVLWKAADFLEARAPEVARIITLETGGTFGWGMFNAIFAASILRESAAAVSQVQGEVIPSNQPGVTALAVRRPVGVVLGIAPWNAPMILGVRAVAMPLACGNTVVLKASEETPALHRMIGEILEEAGLPAGAINVAYHLAQGGRRRRRHTHLRSARSPHQFHGLDPRGAHHRRESGAPAQAGFARARRQGAADRVGRRRSRRGRCGRELRGLHASGPICMSTERVVVQASVKDAFLEKLVAKAKALKVGDPTDRATHSAP